MQGSRQRHDLHGNPPTESWGPIDTALEGTPIACGTGVAAFDVFDAGIDVITARRVYDANGNPVRISKRVSAKPRCRAACGAI